METLFSDFKFTGLLLFGLLAAGANVLGGLVLVKSGAHRWANASSNTSSLSAPASCSQRSSSKFFRKPSESGLETRSGRISRASRCRRDDAACSAGYLSIQFFEHTLAPHFHFGAETHPESFMKPSAAYTAVGGLWIHTFFDGVSIASAFLVNFKVGLLVFIAILLHKMPEGFTVASIMLAIGPIDQKGFDCDCRDRCRNSGGRDRGRVA